MQIGSGCFTSNTNKGTLTEIRSVRKNVTNVAHCKDVGRTVCPGTWMELWRRGLEKGACSSRRMATERRVYPIPSVQRVPCRDLHPLSA
ncbi:hypothetical protein Cadr_000010353 [Camelus dromedarius]|uniref:Uncharacterized protein n=1 Tax=Camelus dromedarius TaxID=9838 RepID=A0A5N4DWR3_CAMDR|nr:hypothetical protein Cadr_000010353 [Camelus dromedarius]